MNHVMHTLHKYYIIYDQIHYFLSMMIDFLQKTNLADHGSGMRVPWVWCGSAMEVTWKCPVPSELMESPHTTKIEELVAAAGKMEPYGATGHGATGLRGHGITGPRDVTGHGATGHGATGCHGATGPRDHRVM